MSEHTNEPWERDGHTVIASGGMVAETAGSPWDADVCEANARRICVTVNACAGIPTEALESEVIPELVGVVILLADHLERIGDSRKDAPFVEAGRAVVAKVKGRAS